MHIFRLILFALLISLAACGSDETQININGDAKGLNGVVQLSKEHSVLLAENIKEDGSFRITGTISKPGFYVLELIETGKTEKNEALLYLDKDPVHISFEAKSLKNYPRVSSKSKHQIDVSKYYSKLNPVIERADIDHKNAKNAMEKEMDKADGEQSIKLIENLSKTQKRTQSIRRNFKKNFISNNPSSLLSAYHMINSKEDIINNPTFYSELYEKFSDEVKNSNYGIEAASFINSSLKSDNGSILPAIVGDTPDGVSFNPDKIKGKITLVMFWASWDSGSKKDLQELKAIYKKLKPQGLEILAISLDQSPEKWKKFIKDNELDWIHVSDFKGAYSANVDNFNNNTIPYYFLVGPDLKIADQSFSASNIEIYFNELKSAKGK
ncbi:MAG TPA: TlpA disulfide reductase family protein [Sphingobacteriaceae bacterium]|nr:TlpA disulfide reductase family protein [Sphingobacteriaceae bacterium]